MRYLALLVVLLACGDSRISASERGRLLEMWPVWSAAVRLERCPRPALRTPPSGDASARLLRLDDKSSPEALCLARVKELQPELGPCMPNQHCGPLTLATVKPHDDVVAACAPLYATIDAVAHASAACSPSGSADDFVVPPVSSLGNAVRLEVAPLVAKGQLGEASARVLDAMRLADDYARKGTILGAAFSIFIMSRLVDTLDEIAVDPRLTPDEAQAIARDLDVLLASAPRWDAIMRQEHVSTAFLVSRSEEFVTALADFEAQDRDIHRVCSGTLRDCVAHYDEISGEGAIAFKAYAQHLGMRESALAFLRMQIELRLAPASACLDRSRRRALLQPWADRAIVGDEPEPVVTPPMWERGSDYKPRSVPRVLRCVSATI